MAYPDKIRVLLLREADWWVAQCLEYDIAAQAKTWTDAIHEFAAVVNGRIAACQKEGIDPFDLPRAPKMYWDLAEKAAKLEVEEQIEEFPEIQPGFLNFFQQREIMLATGF
jgi:hypothetical protein